jgi:hypothetical protein
MRKITLLLGAMGGAMAGYVFSNKTLRDEITNAKDAEAAGKILAKHLAKDGKQVGNEVKKFIESDEVQNNLVKAKKYALDQAKELQKNAMGLMKEGQKQMGIAKKVTKAAKKVKAKTKK